MGLGVRAARSSHVDIPCLVSVDVRRPERYELWVALFVVTLQTLVLSAGTSKIRSQSHWMVLLSTDVIQIQCFVDVTQHQVFS